MKSLCIILTALTAGTSPVVSQVEPAKSAITAPKAQSGEAAIHSIRTSYETGKYTNFLKELDHQYKEILEKGELGQLAGMRAGFAEDWEEWENKAHLLQKEKKKELIDAMETQEKSPFVAKVLSAALDLADKEHQDAILNIAHLRLKAPNSGKNADENRLIDIDLEYEFKSLHLDLPSSQIENRKEKHCALLMERLDKMVAASENFKDESLKKAVKLYSDRFDDRLSQNWDVIDLSNLINGKAKPKNAVEEKVASILNQYQEKFAELGREFVAQHEEG